MTRRFVVIGDPVAHSASPAMHLAAFRALGLEAIYEKERVTADSLAAVVGRLRTGELDGINVTVPHKRRVLEHVDAVEESARAIGVANTLVRDDGGRVVAHNTDVGALARELVDLGYAPGSDDAHALVLGTGATARSAIAALTRDLGFTHLTVRGRALGHPDHAARFAETIEQLLRSLGQRCKLQLEPWSRSANGERRVSVVVQATTVGMAGADPGEVAERVVAWEALPDTAVALDVVYGKAVTPFVRAARARGLRAAGGLGMLARQGALAFELFWRRPAPLAAMQASLET